MLSTKNIHINHLILPVSIHPPPPTPPVNVLPCRDAAVPALCPSGQLLSRCAGSGTSVEERLIPRSNCRPTRCSQNVREVLVVTDTTCRLHSIWWVPRGRMSFHTVPVTAQRPGLGFSAHTFTKRMHTFKNITHFYTPMFPLS